MAFEVFEVAQQASYCHNIKSYNRSFYATPKIGMNKYMCTHTWMIVALSSSYPVFSTYAAYNIEKLGIGPMNEAR